MFAFLLTIVHPIRLVDQLSEGDAEVVEHLNGGVARDVALVAPAGDRTG